MNGDDCKRTDPLDVTQEIPGRPLLGIDAAHDQHPKRIGRYRIKRVVGKGGFGLVYLAHDEQLDRLVAIKVPHAKQRRLQCSHDLVGQWSIQSARARESDPSWRRAARAG